MALLSMISPPLTALGSWDWWVSFSGGPCHPCHRHRGSILCGHPLFLIFHRSGTILGIVLCRRGQPTEIGLHFSESALKAFPAEALSAVFCQPQARGLR
jgi:hypothetical protein